METDVNYTVIGGFVVILVAAFILAVIWLSSGLSTGEPSQLYKVYMQESVSGLTVDSTVEYNGVNVGIVKSIELDPKNPQLVEVLLNIRKSTPITVGTKATLNTRGLTGIAYIALKDAGYDTTPLSATPGEKYPVIGTAPSFMLRLDIAVTQMTKSFRELSKSIHALLDDQNLRHIKQSLNNLTEFSDMLVRNNPQFKMILQNGAEVSQSLQSQTLPMTNRALNNMDDFTQQLTRNPSMLIRGREPQPLGPGEK